MQRNAAVKEKPVEPTPEQTARVRYELDSVVDIEAGRRIVIGSAYRRRPHFEGLKDLADDERRALRFYRRQFDRTERSEILCALNIQRGGSSDGPSHGYALAREMLGICESAVGGELLHTLRAVALYDLSFGEVALARYGGRKQTWIEMERGRKGKFVEKIVPNSGRRQQVAEQFRWATEAMAERVKPYLRTGD